MICRRSLRTSSIGWAVPAAWARPDAHPWSGAEIGELRSIERALKLKIVRKKINASERVAPRTVQNTLATRALPRMPGEVFS